MTSTLFILLCHHHHHASGTINPIGLYLAINIILVSFFIIKAIIWAIWMKKSADNDFSDAIEDILFTDDFPTFFCRVAFIIINVIALLVFLTGIISQNLQ